MSHTTEAILIPGPIGQLETLFSTPENPQAIGVICHPHPQQEGTMHNKVVTTLNKAMENIGWATIRFNYRGVGKSAGIYDNQIGEIDDGMAALQWLAEKFPALPIHVAGFSFGAHIAASMATRTELTSLVTIAPVVTHSDYRQFSQIDIPWLAVVGAADDIVSPAEIEAAAAQYPLPLELITFADTSHFFHGKLIELREEVMRFYEAL